MFSFGKFVSLKGVGGNYSVWELALFLLIGCLGGLLGAFFNRTNEKLTLWRMTHIQPSAKKKCLEVLAVCGAMSFLSYVLPLCWTKCTPLPSVAAMNADGWTEQERVRKREGEREGRRGGVMPLLYSFLFGTYSNTPPPSLPPSGAGDAVGAISMRPREAVQRAGLPLLYGLRHSHQAM